MSSRTRGREVSAVCLAALLTLGALCAAQEPAASPLEIRGKQIAALREELAEAGEAKSSARKRRAYKSVIRAGEALLRASAAAPNRWPRSC